MQEPEVFVLADRTLNGVVAQIRDDQWDVRVPADFQTGRTDHVPTLREIIDYHAYDDAWVPDMLAGRTMDEVGREAYRGDLLGSDRGAGFAAVVERACAAAEAVTDLDRPVHTSFGDFPIREYFWQITQFRALRAHDVARLIGVDPTLPPELVQGVWEQLTPHIEEWRAIGVFPAAIPVPANAPLQSRLLGLTGRQP